MPTVSVIIPTYNRAAYLPETLDSVLAQTYRDFEIIVVDDGSTDNTSEVLRPYHDRIINLLQANQREGAARNHGISRASGELLAFLDSDDLWLPHKLEADVAALRRSPEAGLAYSRVEYISGSGEWIGGHRLATPEGDVFDALLRENFITLSSVTVRRNALESVGLFNTERDLSGSMDWEAWVRVAARYPVTHVPSVTTQVRVHGQNMLSDGSYMERAMSRAVELMLTNPNLRPRLQGKETMVRANLYLAIAVNHYANGNMQRARDYLARAIHAWPPELCNPKLVGTLLKSLLGTQLVHELRRSKRHFATRRPRFSRSS